MLLVRTRESMMIRMDYSETPHAYFKFERGSTARVDDDLPQVLAHHLGIRLYSVRVRKTWLFGSWSVALQMGQKSYFRMFVARSKYENDEWVLLIGPLDIPPLRELLRGRKPVTYSPELVQTCQEVHASLIGISGVTRIRWYFEGFHSQSAAVATPDELPWTRP